jgi:hypothetical protein
MQWNFRRNNHCLLVNDSTIIREAEEMSGVQHSFILRCPADHGQS